MVKLADTTPTEEELSGLAEKLGYTYDDVAVLTPEERAELLEEGEPGQTEPVAKKPKEKDDEGNDRRNKQTRHDPDEAKDKRLPHQRERLKAPPADDDDADGNVVDPPQPKPAAKKPEAHAAPANNPDDDDDDAEPDGPSSFLPTMDAPEAKDYEAEYTKIERDKAAITQKWNDGDCSTTEYSDTIAKLDRQIRQLARDEQRSEDAARFNENNAKRLWAQQQVDFLVDHSEYDRDLNPARFGALDQAVRSVGGKHPDWSGTRVLREAHKMVQAEFGAKASADAPAKPAAEDKPVDKPNAKGPRAQPNLKLIPKTLVEVPAAADPDEFATDRFTHIDNLDGLAQEEAIARLTDSELAEYLRTRAAA